MPQWDFESSRRLSCIDVAHLGSLSPARATCIFAGGGSVPEGAPPNPVATGEGKDSDNGCRYGAGRVFARRGCGGDQGGLRPGISGGARSRPAMKKPPPVSREGASEGDRRDAEALAHPRVRMKTTVVRARHRTAHAGFAPSRDPRRRGCFDQTAEETAS